MALYCCGSNGSGQLGLGHTEDVDSFVKVMDLPEAPQFAAGGNHTILLVNGQAWFSGTIGEYESTNFNKLDGEWKHCGAGWDFYLLASKRSIYIYSASSSQLALLHTFESPIKSIHCGMAHSVVCLENSDIYGFGQNRQGQLGPAGKLVSAPTKLPLKGTNAKCGRDYTLILGGDGIVRGLGKRVATVEATDVTAIYCGWSFYGIQTENVLQWYGNNAFGQLRAPHSSTVAVGSEHGVAFLRESRTIECWGWGEHGNCPAPLLVDTEPLLFAGCATSWYWIATSG